MHRSHGPIPTRPSRRLTGFVLGSPAAFVLYVYAVFQFRGVRLLLGNPTPGMVVPPAVCNLAVTWVVVGTSVTVAVLAWQHGQRIAPVASVLALLAHPWTTAGMQPLTPELFLIVGVTSVAIAGESLARTAPTLTRRTAATAVAVGIGHVLVGGAIQFTARPQWRRDVFEGPLDPMLAGIAASLFVIGVTVVSLRRQHRLQVPAIVLGGWVLAGLLLLGVRWPRLPVSEMTAPNPFLPAPDYLFSWPVLTLVLLAGTGVEYLYKQTRRGVPVGCGGPAGGE